MTNNLFKDGALVFDIGANEGQSVERLSAAGAGSIVSVEPCVENFSKLVAMCAEYPCVKPLMAAAWGSTGIIEVRYSKAHSGWSTTNFERWSKAYPDAAWGDPQQVVAVTLDMLMAHYGVPEYLKIDVEGAEYEVLRGMTRRPKTVAFEFHWKFFETAEWCLSRLKTLRYSNACYTVEDIDLETVPTLSIDETLAKMKEVKPDWGNITVQ